MSDIHYANEKFYNAVDSLCGDGPLKTRIHYAFMSFHPVQASDFADAELRAKYEEIRRRLTVVKDGPEDRGYVLNTLDAMSDDEARQLSHLIVELAFNIEDVCARG